MNAPAAKPTAEALLKELGAIILTEDKAIRGFVEVLVAPYEDAQSVPWRWMSKVIRFGVAAGATKELMRWLILKDFEDRSVGHNKENVNAYIDGVYAEQKSRYERLPAGYHP